MDLDEYPQAPEDSYEPGYHVLRLAEREIRTHPEDTLGSLFDRFVSSEETTREMTAFAFREEAPDEQTQAFMNQELMMCCLELGSDLALVAVPGVVYHAPNGSPQDDSDALAIGEPFGYFSHL
jgi:hypothetical protein